MKPALRIFSILMILAVAGVLVAGCSDSSDTSDTQSSSDAVVVTTESIMAKYSAGDIVKNPKSTGTSGLLILGYDAGADTYERAYIYPNTDGSWGYRLDAKTEKISRSTIESVYSDKVGSVEVSAVPVGKLTTATATATTSITTVETTTATSTETTTAAAAPKITDIEPGKGATGTTVSITSLEGKNFVSGANVTLKKSGQTSIIATSVSVTSSELLTCSFAIPTTAGTGFWDVIITNPDGQSYSWANGFMVTQGSTTATTTTTASTSSTRNPESISYVLTSPIRLGVTINSQKIEINGVNLTCTSGDYLRLVSSSHTLDSQSGSYYCPDTRSATAYFTIPAGYQGTYTVQIRDSNSNIIGYLTDGLVIDYT